MLEHPMLFLLFARNASCGTWSSFVLQLFFSCRLYIFLMFIVVGRRDVLSFSLCLSSHQLGHWYTCCRCREMLVLGFQTFGIYCRYCTRIKEHVHSTKSKNNTISNYAQQTDYLRQTICVAKQKTQWISRTKENIRTS